MTTNEMERSKIVESSDTVEAIEECYRMGWSDGLPVVPPVDYKVREMLEMSGFTGEEEIISLEMRNRVLTSENVAANAVMAGCLPEYFPVLITTLKTLEEEKNFVHMASASTSSPAILMVLNGPIRDQISANYKDGLLGPGNRANASLGRAIRLCFINGFDARPGTLDRGTLGNPSKYTLCFAENEEDSPWEPMHVARGFKKEDSTVTVAVAYNPITVNNSYGHTGESILAAIADTLKSAAMSFRFPSQWVLVIGPEHAITLNDDFSFTMKVEVYEDDERTLVEQNKGLGELLRIMVLQNRVERDKSSRD